MNPILQFKIRSFLCFTSVGALIGFPMSATGMRAAAEPTSLVKDVAPAKDVAVGPDFDGDGIPDVDDNCQLIPNPGQENTDLVLNEPFECDVFSNWNFTYSSNGQQSGSHANGAGIWSSTIVTKPSALDGKFSARLYADSPEHGGFAGPWDARAAIDTTVLAIQTLQATIQFVQIQGSGGNGGSWFQISVISVDDPTKAVSYGFNTTGDAPGDVKTTVVAGERISFNRNFAEDYFNKYAENLTGIASTIIRFTAFADFGENGGGRRTTEVLLDDVRLSRPDLLGDVCDYCAPVYSTLLDTNECLGAIAEALDLPADQGCGVSFSGDDLSLAVTPRFGTIDPSMGEDFVVMCTREVLQPDAELGSDLEGDDSATLTLTLDTPPGACSNSKNILESSGDVCTTHNDCTAGETCAKSNYNVKFCYHLLTADYSNITGVFGDTFIVRLTDSAGTTTLVEYSSSHVDCPITPAPDSMVAGMAFDRPPIEPDCTPDAAFVRKCVDFNLPNLNTDSVDLEFIIQDTVNTIRDTCVILDFLQLTNLEVVDPNPELLAANGQIKTSVDDVKEGGRDVGGASADGVTRVLLREEVVLPIGKVEFCLDAGTAPADGGLSLLGETGMNQCVCASVEETKECAGNPLSPDCKFFAFAVYWVPAEFNRGGSDQVDDNESAGRQVDFRSTWFPICTDPLCVEPPGGTCLRIGLDNGIAFKLVRPPLLLVHGIWSKAGTWDDFPLYDDEQKRERYSIQRADYEDTNGSYFTVNRTVVSRYIHDAVKKLRDKSPGLAVTQADIAAHSMGGVLSRKYVANGISKLPKYEYKENFFEGDIHKLVTLDTPNLGTPLCNLLMAFNRLPCLRTSALSITVEICPSKYIQAATRSLGYPIGDGAVENLQVCSTALKKIPATGIPTHALIGHLALIDWQVVADSASSIVRKMAKLLVRICVKLRFVCHAIDLMELFCDPPGPGTICNPPALPGVIQDLCACSDVEEAGAIIGALIEYFIGKFGGVFDSVTAFDGIVGAGSQAAGMPTSATTPFGAPGDFPDPVHVFNTSSDAYSDRLEELLNQPATGSLFGNFPSVESQCQSQAGASSSNGFSPPSQRVAVGLASLGITGAVIAPTIDCPAVLGSIYYEVGVVRQDGSTVPLDTVQVVGRDSLATRTDPNHPPSDPFVVCFEVPLEYAGGYEIQAHALDDNGDYLTSISFLLTIDPAAVLLELRCSEQHQVLSATDDQGRMRIVGVYEDDIERDITDHAATQYFSTDGGVVTPETAGFGLIPEKGILQANGSGLSVVSASHKGLCCNILVEVLDGKRPIADAGPDQIVIFGKGSLVDLQGAVDCGPESEACPQSPTFHWEQISGPDVELDNPFVPGPTFLAVVEGEYVFQLLIDGGNLLSLPDTVTVQARCYESAKPVTDSSPKNRFVSVKPGDAGRSQAIRVRFVELPAPFDVWEFDNPSRDPLVDGPGDYFVGEPFQVCENGGEVLFSCTGGICSNPPNNACSTDVDCCGAAGPLPRNWFWVAPLECDPQDAHKMDWHGECNGGTCVGGLLESDNCATDEDCVDVVHLFHEGFVPDGVYDVQVVDSTCSLQEEGSYSTPLRMTQGVWGDICSDGPGGACTGVADGNPEVIQDVLGLIDKFQNINALQKSRADLVPGDDGEHNGPDFKVTIIGDALFALDAFQGFAYPFTPGDPCEPG